jgi:alanine dehydrogenase
MKTEQTQLVRESLHWPSTGQVEADTKIGVPKEVKNNEARVSLTPAGARELTLLGHRVIVEHNAGAGIGIGDDAYRAIGAEIVDTADEVFAVADLIVKVKEPQPEEIRRLRDGQVLFTYLHLAADKAQTEGLMRSGATCIAYETVTDARGSLPLLSPMSEVAGRMSIQVGAHCLEKEQGGAGILLGGVPGVPPANVVVLGGGVSGTNSARMAVGLEANVTIIDQSLARLKELDLQFGPRAKTLFATAAAIETAVLAADLVIGAVLVPGAMAPKLVSREMVRAMRPGSVLVDIAIDQGGCFETSHPTTHSAPTFVEEGVVHYCVTNMPGAVARTSTFALEHATLPFVIALVKKGWHQALQDDPHLAHGLMVHGGKVMHAAVAQQLGLLFTAPELALA